MACIRLNQLLFEATLYLNNYGIVNSGSVGMVPWIPGNPSIFELWVPEPINFGKKGLEFTHFLLKTEIGVENLKYCSIWEPIKLNS